MSSPLQKRDALAVTLANAQRRYSDAVPRRQAAEVEVGQARRGLMDVTTANARGQATDDDLTAAHAQLREADAELAESFARENAALDAVKALGYELDTLIGEHLGVFADEAQAATDAAGEAILGLQAGFRAAQGAWGQAQAAWAPIASVAGVAGVGEFPLPDIFASVHSGAIVARPPNVRMTA